MLFYFFSFSYYMCFIDIDLNIQRVTKFYFLQQNLRIPLYKSLVKL